MGISSDQHHPVNRFADRLAGLNDPSMGSDEREREVTLRAYTVASTISLYLVIAVGLLFALIGAAWWSMIPILSSGIFGAVAAEYARQEGVDLYRAGGRIAGRRFVVTEAISGVLALCWVAALAFHLGTGHPVFQVGLGTVPASGGSTGLSTFLGGVCGAGLVIIGMMVRRRRQRTRDEQERTADLDAPDED